MIHRFPGGVQFTGIAPMRIDYAGMSDLFSAHGKNVNACLLGLNARIYAETRVDDFVIIDSGSWGVATKQLSDIYCEELPPDAHMFFKALKMYPEEQLDSGLNIWIDCQYKAGGLSSSSTVAAVIHAFIQKLFGISEDPYKTVWKIIRTEPHQYGRQDQLAALFGGINLWEMEPEEFDPDKMRAISFSENNISRKSLDPKRQQFFEMLHDVTMIYESGIDDGAGEILKKVAKEHSSDKIKIDRIFNGINELAEHIWQIFTHDWPTPTILAHELGPVLNQVRDAHAELHVDVLNTRLTDLFEVAINNGATGCRINGAGSRGTLTICSPPQIRAKIEAALDKVDTPGPRNDSPVFGHQIHFGGFDMNGARCEINQF